MGQYTSYYLYQKYEKRGDGEWLPVNPNVYSVDGDGTMPVSVKTDDDPSCGYVPPIEPQYRWVDLDPDTDYYCISCGSDGYKISGTYGESGESFSVNCDSSSVLTSGDTSAYSAMTYAKVGYCITEIGNDAFSAEEGLSGVSIPSTVTTIGASAFTNSNALINCALPNSVTSIGDYAFANCTSLSNIMLWNSVISIGASAFYNCDSIISINIPTGLTSITDNCFGSCGALSEVAIPSGVTTIGNAAFSGCSGLISITVLPTTPPTLGSNVFDGTNNCPIYVPAASVENYKTSSGWSSYASRIQPITA